MDTGKETETFTGTVCWHQYTKLFILQLKTIFRLKKLLKEFEKRRWTTTLRVVYTPPRRGT